METKIKTNQSLLSRAAVLLLLLVTTLPASAADFITDVMLIGNSDKTEIGKLLSDCQAKGWISTVKDLNGGCGSGSDYIYLLYKTQSSTGSSGTAITGFYIKTGKNSPAKLTHDDRTYNLVSYDGSTKFKDSQGDLNRGAGGDYIHLYYTTDAFPDLRTVSKITFNDTQSGGVGADGGTTGYDLNEGCGSGTDYIYMHVAASKLVTLTSKSGNVLLQDGDILTGEGGSNTRITIADGATVTLRGVNITAIPGDKYHQWAGISCLGDAVIILNKGTTNEVKGGQFNPGIYVPKDKTLTIQSSGKLNATGGSGGAGIGSGYKTSCGNIIISGGTVTAKGGDLSSGIGSGYDNSSCGNITITNGVTTVTAKSGYGCDNAIGAGKYSTCGTITIGDELISKTEGDTRTLYHDAATAIHSSAVSDTQDSDDGWFTISGQRISGTPQKSGVYINAGRKVMIR